MPKCNKNTDDHRHIARRYHYVRQGTIVDELISECISTENQLADIFAKSGNAKNFFSPLWSIILH